MSDMLSCPSCGATVPQGESCPRCLLTLAEEPHNSHEGSKPLDLTDLPMPGESRVIADKYTILATIAHGGMGVVYKARQENLNRVVAVKMLLGGVHASEDYKRRFLQEAKSAAQLNHPNIVAIHDWGEESGQPYFSMDYIEGGTLAEMAREQPLPGRAAAEIVRTLSHAMHYAHTQGVLHRDLKPSNVLVNSEGVPRLTDFGLARQMGEGSELTGSGQFLGTPGFLPPEQASTKSGAIGPASDVYGLGAILYFLLTARAPFLAETVEQMVRLLFQAEPISPRLLNPSVPRDLETICLKCLAKDPKRRYEAAQDLADDLGRFLRGEPIKGRPTSRVEKARLRCRRHPTVAALGALSLLLALAGFAAVVWQLEKTKRAMTQVSAEAQKSDQVATFLQGMISGIRPDVARGRDTTLVREILTNAVARMNGNLIGQPEVQAELLSTVGHAYEALSDYQEAEATYMRLLAVLRGIRVKHPRILASSLCDLANVLHKQGKLEEALPRYREALAVLSKPLPDSHWPTSWLSGATKESITVNSLDGLAAVLQSMGNFQTAEACAREALKLAKSLPGDDWNDSVDQTSLTVLGLVLMDNGKPEEARQLLQEALAKAKTAATMKIDNEDSSTIRLYRVHQGLNNLAAVHMLKGEYREAEVLYRESLTLLTKQFGNVHPEVAEALANLGVLLQAAGNVEEADSLLQQSLEITRKLYGNENLATAKVLRNLASLHRQRGNLSEAEKLLRECLALTTRITGTNSADFASSIYDSGKVLSAEGKLTEAEELLRQALGIRRNLYVKNNRVVAESLEGLAKVLELRASQPLLRLNGPKDLKSEITMSRAKEQEAERLYGEGVEVARNLYGRESMEVCAAIHPLVDLMFRQQRLSEAATLASEELKIREKLRPNERETLHVRALLAALLFGERKHEQAEPLLLRCYQSLTSQNEILPLADKKAFLTNIVSILIEIYATTGRTNKATEWKQTFAEIRQEPATANFPSKSASIDLSAYFNASVADTNRWHDRPQNNLSRLPTGSQFLGGVNFDVHGIIQLSAQSLQANPRRYPEKVTGIRVDRRCVRLHFLHSMGFGGDTDGTEVGAYIIHFDDGQAQEIPIVSGSDVAPWWGHIPKDALPKRATLAWTGLNGAGEEVNLFKTTWKNPRPEMEIVSLDYVSRMKNGAPFVIAITAE